MTERDKKMMRIGFIMSLIKRVLKGELTQKAAAITADISTRTMRRIQKRYSERGKEGLVHGNTSRISNKRTALEVIDLVIRLKKETYHDYGPTLFTEMLKQRHTIIIGVETVRTIWKKAGLHKARSRGAKIFLQRQRKQYEGEMIQFDGSDHDWFEKRADRCTLLAAIDDATSRVSLRFVKAEGTFDVMLFWYDYIQYYGRPCSIYTDRGSAYCVNKNNDEKEKKSQFERACLELDIKPLLAYSPQAKGRVERVFQTLQDRLVKKLRELNISSIEQANEYLKHYLPEHNNMFMRKPSFPDNLHRPILGYNLKNIFCIKEIRIVCNDRTIQYHKRIFQILSYTSACPNDKIIVLEHIDNTIALQNSRGYPLSFEEIKLKPKGEPPPLKNYIPKPSAASKAWAGGSTRSFFKKKELDAKTAVLESRVKPASPAVEANVKTGQIHP